MKILALLAGLLLMPAVFAEGAADLYAAQCAACHGPDAMGMQAAAAPRLAGQNAAYLHEQMLNYQQGKRGVHADDIQGQVMRVLSLNLTAEEVSVLANYLARLGAPSGSLDIFSEEMGAVLYRDSCATCHGQHAQGAESIYVPNLRILSSWYLDAQLKAYGKSWRGGENSTTRAKGMRAINGQFSNNEERAAVTRYISSP